jgi:predicted amidophosphoribosyltransferase
MALIICPDCAKHISDAAISCPHCGRPMRMSREAVLVEIQNAQIEHDRMMAVVDDIVNADYYHETHKSTMDKAFENMDHLAKRIGELKALL